ncbi:winged helix-turn-helix domain-containing protein [Bradyrhizobium sp. LHD-71]|uniref:winged helix-turn-helix domain-containing protein n=1 Tax=Bradyrhizobium sp. LHD-71 TaxID=3072141 RepID=UPI00280EF81F|nr:winged helix-turn-helix domain-containing protein [Bradyrhizobium sp. LHD-71]MDQ8729814.1 winged helix-turn-helix domain-containing protein [Bradyrhizobium sp. LHD-71]
MESHTFSYRIGDYQLDPVRRELRFGQALRRLEPQVFDTLLFLVENRARVVSKDDLVTAVWNGRFVSDATVESRIKAARRAVGDDGRSQKIIRTIPRRGFRFVADVEGVDGQAGKISSANDRMSLAVLPFRNLSVASGLTSFIDGIVGDLIIDLSKFPSLRVVGHSSTATYHQQPFDLRGMARELDVQYVLEGSLEETCERLRITAQLTEAISGTQLWAERFDINPVDLPAARDDIRMMIVGSFIGVGSPLNKAEQQRAMRKSPDALTARDLYYRSEAEYYKFNRMANEQARALLERFLVLDPGSVAAHSLLARVHLCDAQFFRPECRAQSLDLAHKEARTSVELDPMDYRGHWVLGAVLRQRGDSDVAMAEYERALDLNQNNPGTLAEWGEFLSLSGRADQAVPQIQRAMTLKRFHPDWYIRALDRAYYNARQYEEAIRLGKRLQNPLVSVLENVAASYGQLGRHQEAACMVERILAIKPDHSIKSFIANNPEMEQGVLLHFVEGLRKSGLPER